MSTSLSVVSDSLRGHGPYNPWNSPGQNTGAGSLSLFQEIFPTQGSNPGLPHCRRILYQLSHKGSPTEIYVHINIDITLNQALDTESLINTTLKRQTEFSPEIESQGIRKGYFLVSLQFSGA